MRNEYDPKSSFISNKITGIWGRFDNNFLKPIFIDDWPNVKEDHNQISNKIIDVFNEHQRKKIKNKELTNVSSKTLDNIENIKSLLDDTPIKRRISSDKK